MTAPAEPRVLGYVPQLDGLRAVAVAAVIAAHAAPGVALGGGTGVDVFFVLSGFLITTLLIEERSASGEVSLKNFYLRRAVRLFPALAVVSVFSFPLFWLVQPFNTHETLVGIAVSAAYASSWVRALGVSGLGWFGHTWSLSVEEHFYAVWPVLLLLVFRLRVRRLWIPLFGLFVAAVLYRATAITNGVSTNRLYNSPDFRAEQLLAGCVLAAAVPVLVSLRARSTRGLDLVAVLAGVALLVTVVRPELLPSFYGAGSTLVAIEAALVIASLVISDGSAVARGLAHRSMVWFGRRSYGIYLWHLPMFGLFDLKDSSTTTRVVGRALAVVLTDRGGSGVLPVDRGPTPRPVQARSGHLESRL